jgi:hypothetical protein
LNRQLEKHTEPSLGTDFAHCGLREAPLPACHDRGEVLEERAGDDASVS